MTKETRPCTTYDDVVLLISIPWEYDDDLERAGDKQVARRQVRLRGGATRAGSYLEMPFEMPPEFLDAEDTETTPHCSFVRKRDGKSVYLKWRSTKCNHDTEETVFTLIHPNHIFSDDDKYTLWFNDRSPVCPPVDDDEEIVPDGCARPQSLHLQLTALGPLYATLQLKLLLAEEDGNIRESNGGSYEWDYDELPSLGDGESLLDRLPWT